MYPSINPSLHVTGSPACNGPPPKLKKSKGEVEEVDLQSAATRTAKLQAGWFIIALLNELWFKVKLAENICSYGWFYKPT